MAEISSPDDLEKWLQDKPIEWAQVIAYRCALRAVIILSPSEEIVKLSDSVIHHMRLSVFRLLFFSSGVPHSSFIDLGGLAAEVSASVSEARIIADEYTSHSDAYAAAYAAADAAVDYGEGVTAAVAQAAYAFNISANLANYYIGDDLNYFTFVPSFEALNYDLNWLMENSELKNWEKLKFLPIWPEKKDTLQKQWLQLKQSLVSFDPNWQFWIDWYQSKLDGTLHPGLTQVQQNKLYYQIATFPNELWEEGAEAVNQRIVELMEEIKKVEGNDHEVEIDEPLNLELPPQNKGALQFKTNEDGVIELDQEANENELLKDQDAIDRHNEVDYLANELISSYDPNLPSANAARPIVTKVQRYLEALGETPEDANINFIIPRGEVLRQELEQEENRDEFTNLPPLPDNFKSSLASLVSAHNLYVVLDPVLDERDQARLGPDAKENLVSKEDGLKIVEDAFNEGLIEEEIVGAVNEDAETVNEIPDPERRQDRRFSESIKNLSRHLLSNTQSIAKKIIEKQEDILEVTVAGAGGGILVTGGAIVVSSASWTVIGSIVGTGYTCFKGLQWIVKNEEWIIQRFDNKEEIKAFIEALKKLPLK